MKKLPNISISSARPFFVVNSPNNPDRGGPLRRVRWVCLMFALLCSPAAALERDQPLAQLYHTIWSEKDGLTGAVMALAQTPDGFLWVGTTGGLFRFDGLRFEPYVPENGPLPSASVSVLMAVPDGGLWVGYARGGASLLKDGRSTNYSEREGFPVGRVRSFARDFDGTIWAGVVGSFTRLEGSRWQQVREEWNYPSKTAWTLLVDAQGTLWAPTGNRIMFLPRGERSFRDAGLETGLVLGFAQAPDGTLLFQDNAPPGQLRAFRAPNDPRSDPLPRFKIEARNILFDRHGALWTVGVGLARLPFPERLGGRTITDSSPDVEQFTKKQGLSDDVAWAVLEDREGSIWVGTNGGLDRFRYRNLTWFPFPEGTAGFTLVAGDRGEVWTGVNGDKDWPLSRVPGGQPVAGAPTTVFMTYRDPDGVIWVSARDALLRWEGGNFTNVPPPEEMLKLTRLSPTKDPLTVSAITKDGSGVLWVGIGGGGVFQLKDGAWKFTPILKDHPDWAPNAAFTDAADRVWLAYGDRVAAVEHGGVRTFSAQEGLTVGPVITLAGRDQQVWVGGESGLAFLRGERFHVLKGFDGSGFGPVTGIVSADGDGLWLSAVPGIVHIPEGEAQRALGQPDYKVSYEVFDPLSDLPEQLQRGSSYAVYSPSVVRDSDGMLWFATRNGFARVDPRRIFRNPVPPPVVIRSAVADEKSYPTADATLPPLTKNLRIDYTALSLAIPERVRFRYKLEGWDREWQDAGTRRQAFYTNLGPGDYAFHVIACNNDSVWNEEGAVWAFSVAPAWYQTGLFRLLLVIAGLFAVWSLYRLRVRQIARAINARFDARLDERTRLARELHDTFLQTVQGSKLVADDALEQSGDPVRTRQALEKLSTWLGQATEEGRAALDSLRTSTTETNDLAEAFRRATETCQGQGSTEVAFSVVGDARDMHPIIRDEIYRIGYEAIRNACVHSGASRLEVELRYAQDLVVRVSDDGRGIDPAVAENGKPGHFGLQGMRERAARIGAKLRLVSSANSGTQVTVVVPGRVVYRGAGAAPSRWIKDTLGR